MMFDKCIQIDWLKCFPYLVIVFILFLWYNQPLSNALSKLEKSSFSFSRMDPCVQSWKQLCASYNDFIQKTFSVQSSETERLPGCFLRETTFEEYKKQWDECEGRLVSLHEGHPLYDLHELSELFLHGVSHSVLVSSWK